LKGTKIIKILQKITKSVKYVALTQKQFNTDQRTCFAFILWKNKLSK